MAKKGMGKKKRDQPIKLKGGSFEEVIKTLVSPKAKEIIKNKLNK